MTLAELHRIKQWQLAHRRDHPLEYHCWDGVLTLWLMGWIGWLPALALDQLWALPLCLLGAASPNLYVAWRASAHQRRRLRCDWLQG
ncbi:hypothetical protein [Ramlibacter tataouinensis]|nr:hypothetical protein [Ramlibacter tataouinensis]